jgi:hypothetical protein
MNASSKTQGLRDGAGAKPSEEVLSARLEQAVLQLRDVERQLRRAVVEVLSLQHAVTLIEYTTSNHRNGVKTGYLPSNGRPEDRRPVA